MDGSQISPPQIDKSKQVPARPTTISALRISQPLAYLGAVVVVAGGVLVRLVMQPVLSIGFPFLTLYPAIIIIAYLFGARATILGAVLSLVACWMLFIGPEVDFVLGVRAPVAMMTFLFVAMMVAAMMHTMQTANARLSAERDNSARLAENREVLFRELQHRVGNSLQMVSSVLALQKHKLNEPEAVLAMEEAIRRVALIGKVQRQLYDPDGGAMPMSQFLREICADLQQAFCKHGISLEVTGNETCPTTPDLAMPVAMIVAESVVNAYEHGLAAQHFGAIGVNVITGDALLTIEVTDDGAGLPPKLSLKASQNMGLRLSHKLACYHGGDFTLQREKNLTVARLTMPLPG